MKTKMRVWTRDNLYIINEEEINENTNVQFLVIKLFLLKGFIPAYTVLDTFNTFEKAREYLFEYIKYFSETIVKKEVVD